MENANLRELIAQAQAGDSEAHSKLFCAYKDKVYYFALKILKNQQAAEDVVQETAILVFKNIQKLRQSEAFFPWIKRISANLCYRKLGKNAELLFSQYEDDETNEPFDIADDTADSTPHELLDSSETKRMIAAVVDSLPDDQRMCTYMYYYNGMSVNEISQTLGISENTIKSRLRYSREKIKDGVLAYEKQGTKLYSVPVWLLIGALRGEGELYKLAPELTARISESMAAALAKGSAASVSTASSSASAAGTVASVGKSVGVSLTAKLIAASAAVAVLAVGGAAVATKGFTKPMGVGAFSLIKNNNYELTYVFDENGNLIIDGFTGNIDGELIIPDAIDNCVVVGIAPKAFTKNENCTVRGVLDLPDTISVVTDEIFYGQHNITEVHLPAEMTQFQSSAFVSCSSITAFTIDEQNPFFVTVDGVLYSKDLSTLYRCPNGKEGKVEISEQTVTIEDYAFSKAIAEIFVSYNPYHFGDFSFEPIAIDSSLYYDENNLIANPESELKWPTIHCYDGSAMQLFAQKHKIPVVVEERSPDREGCFEARYIMPQRRCAEDYEFPASFIYFHADGRCTMYENALGGAGCICGRYTVDNGVITLVDDSGYYFNFEIISDDEIKLLDTSYNYFLLLKDQTERDGDTLKKTEKYYLSSRVEHVDAFDFNAAYDYIKYSLTTKPHQDYADLDINNLNIDN